MQQLSFFQYKYCSLWKQNHLWKCASIWIKGQTSPDTVPLCKYCIHVFVLVTGVKYVLHNTWRFIYPCLAGKYYQYLNKYRQDNQNGSVFNIWKKYLWKYIGQHTVKKIYFWIFFNEYFIYYTYICWDRRRRKSGPKQKAVYTTINPLQ